jgi:hypothetical protein
MRKEVSMNTKLVVNLRKEKYDVYIGRGSIFGNPFHIGKDGNREEVIEKYKKYFEKRIAEDCKFKNAVLSLKGKVLGCYCKPLKCHGDVIAEYLDSGAY